MGCARDPGHPAAIPGSGSWASSRQGRSGLSARTSQPWWARGWAQTPTEPWSSSRPGGAGQRCCCPSEIHRSERKTQAPITFWVTGVKGRRERGLRWVTQPTQTTDSLAEKSRIRTESLWLLSNIIRYESLLILLFKMTTGLFAHLFNSELILLVRYTTREIKQSCQEDTSSKRSPTPGWVRICCFRNHPGRGTPPLIEKSFPGSSDGKEFAYDARDPGLIPRLGRCPGEGNDYPLHCSCLENSMDRGAWWATIHGVEKSLTRLKQTTRRKSLIFLPWREKALDVLWLMGNSKCESWFNPEWKHCITAS